MYGQALLSHTQLFINSNMPFLNIKKQYLAIGMLVFVVLFLFNSRPAFQCQFNQEANSYLPTIYGITPTYSRLAQKADLTRYVYYFIYNRAVLALD